MRMKLKVIKPFNGRDEGKVLSPGDVVVTTDIDRINALVGRGYCEITSLEDESSLEDANTDGDIVELQGVEYSLVDVKAALSAIGAPVSGNAGIRGVSNALDKLSEEQIAALLKVLNKEEE